MVTEASIPCQRALRALRVPFQLPAELLPRLEPAYVYQALHLAIVNYPEEKKNLDFLKAHLFYAEALIAIGDRQQALGVFQMLLDSPAHSTHTAYTPSGGSSFM